MRFFHHWYTPIVTHLAHVAVAATLVAAPAAVVHPAQESAVLIGNNAGYTPPTGGPMIVLPGLAGSEDVVYVLHAGGWCSGTDLTRTYGLPIVSGPSDPRCNQ